MNPNEATSQTNSQTGFNFFGLAGFVVSALSASLCITAILTWKHIAAKELNFEGGSAFSMNIMPLLVTWAGIGIGVVGLIITAASILSGKKRTRYGVEFIHILSGVFLAPAAYLLFEMFFG